MKTRIVLLAILGLVFSSNAFTRNMPSGSFLNKPVQNAKQLVSQLQTDVVVARRYKQQFGVSVVNYFKGNLQTSKLKKAGKYNVYYYSSKSITRRVEHLSKGTYVFVDRQGKPVLKMRCGNPLVSQLRQVPKPPAKSVTKNISKPVVPKPVVSNPAIPTPVVPTPAIEVPPAPTIQTVEVAEAEIPPLIPPGVAEIVPIEETLSPPIVIQEIPVAAIPAVTKSTSDWFLAPVGIGVALFLLDKGGGGNEQPSTVPESSSMIVLATGICSMGLLYRRRQK